MELTGCGIPTEWDWPSGFWQVSIMVPEECDQRVGPDDVTAPGSPTRPSRLGYRHHGDFRIFSHTLRTPMIPAEARRSKCELPPSSRCWAVTPQTKSAIHSSGSVLDRQS